MEGTEVGAEALARGDIRARGGRGWEREGGGSLTELGHHEKGRQWEEDKVKDRIYYNNTIIIL